jgi:ribosome maturation factor RimP
VTPSGRVRAVLEPVVDAAGLVLEDVSVTPAGRRRVVRVVVDLPDEAVGGVDLDAVAAASTAVSEALDASDVLGGGPYVLEVTSPGVDRPLTQRRHWLRARGRLVVAELDTGGSSAAVAGRVLAVDEVGVQLSTADGTTTLPWSGLRAGRVQVEFARTAEDPDRED